MGREKYTLINLDFSENLDVDKIIIGGSISGPQTVICNPIIWKHSFCLQFICWHDWGGQVSFDQQ